MMTLNGMTSPTAGLSATCSLVWKSRGLEGKEDISSYGSALGNMLCRESFCLNILHLFGDRRGFCVALAVLEPVDQAGTPRSVCL